jgi:hypothetical protein
MKRASIGVLTMVALLASGIAPLAAGAPAGDMGGHACCRRLVGQVSHQHGCAAAALRCCSTPRDRRPEVPAPPGHTPAPTHDLVPLKGLNAPAVTPHLLTAAVIAGAFVASQLKLPPDPLYLRHLVLLV